ncbi:hypothetical protein Poly41_14920 [Novipirellula artificiosorum]|uniref:Uncharacterized protein n=1 Tax=Novipirellula artificiosorum TaxID=2528016 RepID=A0A5C6DVL3_9BACT|nr:hypothetical protein Poly41_14920 [Novipirellula artificiosorum]
MFVRGVEGVGIVIRGYDLDRGVTSLLYSNHLDVVCTNVFKALVTVDAFLFLPIKWKRDLVSEQISDLSEHLSEHAKS